MPKGSETSKKLHTLIKVLDKLVADVKDAKQKLEELKERDKDGKKDT